MAEFDIGTIVDSVTEAVGDDGEIKPEELTKIEELLKNQQGEDVITFNDGKLFKGQAEMVDGNGKPILEKISELKKEITTDNTTVKSTADEIGQAWADAYGDSVLKDDFASKAKTTCQAIFDTAPDPKITLDNFSQSAIGEAKLGNFDPIIKEAQGMEFAKRLTGQDLSSEGLKKLAEEFNKDETKPSYVKRFVSWLADTVKDNIKTFALLGLAAFLTDELLTAWADAHSGCMVDTTDISSGKTFTCKFLPFSCTTKSGTDCGNPNLLCDKAKKTMNTNCTTTATDLACSSAFNKNGYCSDFCTDDNMITVDGTNKYHYHCEKESILDAFGDFINGLEYIAKQIVDVPTDVLGFLDKLGSVGKYIVIGIISLIILYIIYLFISNYMSKQR